MTGCIACYSTGDSTSVVSRTVDSVRISCYDVETGKELLFLDLNVFKKAYMKLSNRCI